ncbi:MAG: type II toxin-antitoxin system VapC family toxin, partial [Cyanobacteria bacterium P01_G01_bin.49]
DWSLTVTGVSRFSSLFSHKFNFRTSLMTQAQTTQALSLLKSLEIVMDEETEIKAFNATLTLGREQGLASYDAAYLELALRLGIPLATSDNKLRTAANQCSVTLMS